MIAKTAFLLGILAASTASASPTSGELYQATCMDSEAASPQGMLLETNRLETWNRIRAEFPDADSGEVKAFLDQVDRGDCPRAARLAFVASITAVYDSFVRTITRKGDLSQVLQSEHPKVWEYLSPTDRGLLQGAAFVAATTNFGRPFEGTVAAFVGHHGGFSVSDRTADPVDLQLTSYVQGRPLTLPLRAQAGPLIRESAARQHLGSTRVLVIQASEIRTSEALHESILAHELRHLIDFTRNPKALAAPAPAPILSVFREALEETRSMSCSNLRAETSRACLAIKTSPEVFERFAIYLSQPDEKRGWIENARYLKKVYSLTADEIRDLLFIRDSATALGIQPADLLALPFGKALSRYSMLLYALASR